MVKAKERECEVSEYRGAFCHVLKDLLWSLISFVDLFSFSYVILVVEFLSKIQIFIVLVNDFHSFFSFVAAIKKSCSRVVN
jgi:hypothetical protein